jgi:tetratricopeptide (TPR) repeat protein
MSSISQRWKTAKVKDPPLSVVLNDHLGKSGAKGKGQLYKKLQVDASNFLKSGRYEDCVSSCLQAQKLIIKLLGVDSVELIYVKLLLGESYYFLGENEKSIQYIEEAGKLLDTCPGIGNNHIYRLYYYRDLAQIYQLQERYDESLGLFQRVAETRRIFQGETHPDTALSLVDLGIALKVGFIFEISYSFLDEKKIRQSVALFYIFHEYFRRSTSVFISFITFIIFFLVN